MHILVAGWFSFEHMGNSAGDMIARDTVCNWLREASVTYDVAVADPFPFQGGVNIESADPSKYTDVLFVCGPFGNGSPITEMLARFAQCRLIGVNLTLLHTLEQWNPFTLLYERDSSRQSNPDIAFFASPSKVPVVGKILIEGQAEYGKRDISKMAHEAIELFIQSREISVVNIDTVLENNKGSLRSPGEIESLIAKMDVVITTRLHGTVLALKNGVPVIPIDPVEGGAKISRQVEAISWPLLLQGDNLNDKSISDAFTFCLTEEAKIKAMQCAERAVNIIDNIRIKFIKEVGEFKKLV